MAKKVISFIVILLVFCTAGAAVLIGTSNFGLGFGGMTENPVSSAYALDRAGDIYYVNRTSTGMELVCVDSTGKRLFEKKLDPAVFGGDFTVSGIYVEHDKGIYLTVYEYDPETLFISRVSIQNFYEDGTYAGEVFSQKVSCLMNARTLLVSSFSEDDNAVYFALLDNGTAEVFSALKNNSEPAAKIADHRLPDAEIYGAYAFTDGSVVLGRNGGLTVLSSSGKREFDMPAGSPVFDRFWNGIDLVYGMEWLSKNGRTAEENAELVKKNPFIPYSILMERSFLERFQKNGEELYTSFPIPIIVKEELEQEQEHVDSRFAAYGNVHFYVMFNTHLLDREELEKILGKIRREIEDLKKAVEDKDADLETYRSYRSVVENQTFSTALCQQTEKEINRLNDERTAVKGRLEEIYREQSRLEEEKKEIETLADTVKEQIDGLKRMDVQFEILLKKYDQYETDRTSLERLKKENRELTEKQTALSVRLGELREQEMGLRALVKEFAEKIDREEKKQAEFEEIARTAENRDLSSLTQMTSEELEARYYALTKVISDSVEELRKSQTDWIGRISGKRTELKKKNEDSQIPEKEYQSLVCTEEQYDAWKRQKKQTERELNKVNEENTALGRKEGALTTTITLYMKNLKKETGYEQPAERKTITDTEFEKRLNLKEYELTAHQKKLSQLRERNIQIASQEAGVEEYVDQPIPAELISGDGLSSADERMSVESSIASDSLIPESGADAHSETGENIILLSIQERVPDVRNEEMDVIKGYQKEIRRKITESSKALDRCRGDVSELIRVIASGKTYADDYFKKTFDSLLSQTASPRNLFRQFEMNRQAYENQLEKLKIDLAHIDDEQKHLEMMFLEYVEQINANIGMIDKNSTISVRGRSLKMLRIQVPDWETEKEHFRLKLHDYFENIVKLGIETIEKNGNLTEFLGRVITTRKLYDDVAGIQNVKIRLYKIEAEREVPISWSEVSANSGGEGFLSAFVILTCLLSYMRRDETDLFTSGEEGKVLIMDNPFAQTNAEHLLKPLIEMAKKTNTQLICLSGLGGDSIYNRFDNIYVLKLVESSIRNGVQRVDVTHMKGEETKRMVLSEFKMEQMSLFEMMEE